MVEFDEFVIVDTDDDRERLIGFVRFVEALLAEIVRDGKDPQGRRLFFEPLLAPMHEAWETGRNEFRALQAALLDLSAAAMDRHGLSRPQLTFKLSVVRHFSALFNSHGKRWLRRLLDVIDTLLKSILDAIGVGGAAGELKDMIRDSIDEEDCTAPPSYSRSQLLGQQFGQGAPQTMNRDQLWNVVYDTYYESFFQELFADAIVSRWRAINDVANFAIALTASGSVASAWILWQTTPGKIAWGAIAGVAALLSIVQTSLGVPARLKDWTEMKQLFTGLRVDLETFRHQMTIDPDFDPASFSQVYNELRDRYRNGMTRVPNDLFRTKRCAESIQDAVDVKTS